MTSRAFRSATLLIFIVGAAILIALVRRQCGGMFVYALDDPYIHLSIAETIARGGYGINWQEYSSPSSSILFPFLLAPFALIGVERLVPLLLGLAANAVSLWLIAGFFHRHAIAGGSGERSWLWLLVAPLLVLAINGIALPIVGMEHPLHVLTVVLTIAGLVTLGETGRVNGMLVTGVLLAPLLRFEGLALSGAALLVLLATGPRKMALLLGSALVFVLLTYALMMHWHGLPLLPSSVMVKSAASAAAVDNGPLGMAGGMARNLSEALKLRQGTLLAVGSVLLLPALAQLRLTFREEPQSRVPETRALVAFCGIIAMTAHLVLGTYGWLGRYEVYVLTVMLLCVTYVLSGAIRRIEPIPMRVAVCALALALLGYSSFKTTWITPAASRNIYEQQYQMYRFAAEFFPHPVAVNDIGAVSYRNDQFVLDLWGLGSEEARQLRKDGALTPDNIAAMVRRHNVALAMIFDVWFPNAVPRDWRPVAHLTTSRVMSADTTVAFYLTDPAYAAEMQQALRRFAATLPAGARLDIVEDGRR